MQATEADSLRRIDGLAQNLPLFDSWEGKAFARKRIAELRANTCDPSRRVFVDADVRTVVATAFKTLRFLDDERVRRMIEVGEAPFTTIVIDEAGLISRAAVAALSLLASRRIVLIGDSKQLAPVSRISRLLPAR